MPNIQRRQREKSADSQILLMFGALLTIAGGFPTALGIGVLWSGGAASGSLWTAMTISVSTLGCGIGTLAYRWRLERKSNHGDASP